MGTCADNGLGTGMSAAEGAPSTYEKTYNRNLLSKRGKCWVAILDRDFLPHRLGKERNRSSKVLVFAIILIAVLMLAAIAGLIGQIGDSKEPLRSDTPVRIPARIAYTTHSPILIIGNGGFTNESGVVWGSGTESDPYIIEGWDINSSTANGIDLQNTYAHFTVRACHVHDGGLSYYGVSLFNCVNGTLENNHCSNNVCGIRLYSGSNNNTLNNNNCSDNSDGIAVSSGKNNTISNNTCCSNNVYGIVLTWSSDSTLSNNTCYSNNECGIYLFYSSSSNPLSNNTCSNNGYGIYLHSSSDSTLSNNTCSNNGYGIVLAWSSDSTLSNNTCSSNNVYGIHLYYSSGGNTLSNNTCSSNNVYGIFLYSSSGNTLNNNSMIDDGILLLGDSLYHWNTHSIDTSNTVNGKPVYYLKDQNGTTVPAGAGQVIIINCTNIGVKNQSLSNTDCGIEIGFSSNILADNNTCSSNNVYGIFLYSSSGNTLSNNTCSNNVYGIYLYYSSSSNTLSNNTCSSNNVYGIFLYSGSNNNTLNNNNCSDNSDGIAVSSGKNNTISNNTCSNNGYGILLDYSSDSTLSNNTCSNNYYGIYIGSSSGNTLNNNTCVSNGWYGVYLFYSSNNRIWNNTLIDNNGATDTYDASHVQAYDDGTSNWWNSTDGYGNYWSDWTTPDVAPPDGIVDIPYDIAGSAVAKDYYPLTTEPLTPIPEFGMMPFVVIVLLVAIVLTIGARRRKT
jgi:parallel beta-helix repeat protein